MDVKQVLEELVSIPEQKEPVASLFLDVRRNDQHQRSAVRIFVQNETRKALKGAGSEEERERLKPTMELIDGYVSGLLRQQLDEWATGIALFCCQPIGLLRVIGTRLPFQPQQFYLAKKPQVAPFVRTVAAIPRVIIAAVDSTGGELYEISQGMVDVQTRVENPFPGFHSRGGWRQRKIQQRIGELRDRNLRAVAEPFVRMADALPDALLVLAGQHFILNKLDENLPPRILDRVIARTAYPSGTTHAENLAMLWQAASPAIDAAVRGHGLALRDVALAEAARNGAGTLGVGPAMQALTEGRAMRLLIDMDFAAEGSRCTVCNALMAGGGPACSYCNGALQPVPLLEEAVRRAIQVGTEVVFLPPGEKLPDGKAMAVILRQRGQSQARHPIESPSAPVS